MKKILLFILSLSFLQLSAQWNNIGPNTSLLLNRCSFPSNDTGYVISDKIYRTFNGGLSFDSITIPNSVGIYSIDFRSNTEGVITVDIASSGNKILRTLNAGATWQDISTQQFMGMGMNVKFADALHGTYLTSAPLIFNTANGGITWDTMTFGPNYFNTLDFPTATTGYIGGFDGTFNYKGVIGKTTDGGVTWTIVNNFTQVYSLISHIQFLTADTGFACFSPYAQPGRLIRTYDGAATWDTVIFNHGGIVRFAFSNYQDGFIVNDSGSIYITHNAGVTWMLDRLQTDYLNDITVTPSHAYAFGYNGLSIKCNLVTGISAQEVNNELKIYPNPTADKITVTLPQATTIINVTATDVTGKNCGNLPFTNGNGNELIIDTHQLAKGFYMLELNSSTERFTVKFEKAN